MVDHFQIWNFLLTLAVSAGAAWGATKFTLKAHEKTLKKHDETFERIEQSIKGLVPMEICKGERSDCRQDRETMICELSRKMDRIFDSIAIQDAKRESGKDEYNRMFMKILENIASLTARIQERSHEIR